MTSATKKENIKKKWHTLEQRDTSLRQALSWDQKTALASKDERRFLIWPYANPICPVTFPYFIGSLYDKTEYCLRGIHRLQQWRLCKYLVSKQKQCKTKNIVNDKWIVRNNYSFRNKRARILLCLEMQGSPARYFESSSLQETALKLSQTYFYVVRRNLHFPLFWGDALKPNATSF